MLQLFPCVLSLCCMYLCPLPCVLASERSSDVTKHPVQVHLCVHVLILHPVSCAGLGTGGCIFKGLADVLHPLLWVLPSTVVHPTEGPGDPGYNLGSEELPMEVDACPPPTPTPA